MERPYRVPLALTVAVILLLALFYLFSTGFQQTVNDSVKVLMSGDRDRISAWTDGFGPWGPIVIVLALVLQIFILFVPSMPILITAVVAYGPWYGGLLAFIGMMLASAVGYGVGRLFSPAHVERFVGKRTQERVTGYIHDYGALTVGVARFSPIISSDAVSIVSGLLRMDFWKYMLASAVGTVGLVGIVGLLGADLDRLLPGLVALSILTIAGYVGYIIYDRRRKKG